MAGADSENDATTGFLQWLYESSSDNGSEDSCDESDPGQWWKLYSPSFAIDYVYCACINTCMHVDLLHAGSDSIPDDSSSGDESSSQEMEPLPEAPEAPVQGPAVEPSDDEDSDMEHEGASAARDAGMCNLLYLTVFFDTLLASFLWLFNNSIYNVFSIHSDQVVPWCGFKCVGDNIDKNVKPRYMRTDRRTSSLHFFNAYAVLDRIDCSKLACSKVPSSGMRLDINKILPNDEDWYQLIQNCTILLSRVLVEYIPFFECLRGVVCRHITHDQCKAMKQKSVVVRYNIRCIILACCIYMHMCIHAWYTIMQVYCK